MLTNNNSSPRWLLGRFITIGFLLLFISACSTTKTKPVSVIKPIEQLPDDDVVIIVPAPENKKYVSSAVVQGLLDKSRRKFEKGDFSAATNFLERGINISPNNPLLWQRLAVIRFEQGNYRQAKQLAAKSNVLVEGDQRLRAINEKIIHQANQNLKGKGLVRE